MDNSNGSDTHNNPTSLSHSPTNSSSSSQLPQVVMSPCAACKILRRRCADKCVLAPYFPPTDPAKFTIAHRVFGASNIIKLLQELPESQRVDAVTSMVYEASARIRDPVYGCAGAICQLQKQVNELQAQLAKSQAEIVNMQLQQANLVARICMEMAPPNPQESESPQQSVGDFFISSPPQSIGYGMNFLEENTSLNTLWEPLWT
ncbi:LOB domain-containing protein 1-like [Lotus japonicus]|uniref:LOB domain-containing protein 1-like n=1 Tax=Lotus japonicus TaxID=34305 RepID=UPI00258D2B7D|nr:LOB domain-containing protein 1-like [Lotus japonicus]